MQNYREIKFTYNLITYSIDVRLENESVEKQEFSAFRRAINGTAYKQYITSNIKRNLSYRFSLCDNDVFSFFYNAYNAQLNGLIITMQRELDNGSFEEFDIIIQGIDYDEFTISQTEKLYRNLSVSISEI